MTYVIAILTFAIYVFSQRHLPLPSSSWGHHVITFNMIFAIIVNTTITFINTNSYSFINTMVIITIITLVAIVSKDVIPV